ATHGNSISHRHLGSTGQCQWPGKVWKGKKMAGQYGNKRITAVRLKVAKVDEENDAIFIAGAIPGAPGTKVIIKPAVKQSQEELDFVAKKLEELANQAEVAQEAANTPVADATEEEKQADAPVADATEEEKQADAPVADATEEEKQADAPVADATEEEKQADAPVADATEEEKQADAPVADEPVVEEKQADAPVADATEEEKQADAPVADKTAEPEEKQADAPVADATEEEKQADAPVADKTAEPQETATDDASAVDKVAEDKDNKESKDES
ncbi:MAG: hypothetical protein HAW61_04410, partial [Candidatus Portiera sp.]|nr:hypothetical protein [Portiera sp.]